MTIVTHPAALELSGNLTKFLISATSQFNFVLKKNGVTILEQVYDPGTIGLVEVDVHEIIQAHLTYSLQDALAIYEQTNIVADFTAEIGAESIAFTVIRAGVDRFADSSSNFLTSNFLTWQPQVKKISFYSPEFLTYYAPIAAVAKLIAYYSDNTTENLTIGNLTAGKAYTIPLQYSLVNSLLTKKLPSYYDVFVTSIAGEQLSYIQRFVATNKLSEDEKWIIFENSLGGADTIRAYGSDEFIGEHTHNIASFDDAAEEYRIDTLRKYNKNTGYLDLYERRWLLDFFPSRKKYIYENLSIIPIVVSESDVNYKSNILPSAYNFTYQYALSKPLLNITRVEILPAEITIFNPDIGSFTLPPRLIDFPRITLSGGALIPVQAPYSETFGVTTLDALAAYLLTTTSLTDLVSLISGIDQKFLSKVDADTAAKFITFTEGLKTGAFIAGATGSQINGAGDAELRSAIVREISTLLKGVKIGDYQQGLSGGIIDQYANAELESLNVRGFLETAELRKNRITVNGNESWFTDVCVVESVERIGTSDEYVITPRLTEGDLISFRSSDIVRGIYSYDNGFYTAVMQVVTVNSELTSMVVLTLNNKAPMPNMVLARQSNSADTERQGSIYADGLNKWIRVMNGYDTENPTSIGGINQLKVQLGNLIGINHPIFGELEGYGLYAQNVYLSGRILQSNWDGTEFQTPNYWMGTFNLLTVYHVGDLVRWFLPMWGEGTYRCIKTTTAGISPSNDEYWESFIPAGAPAYQAHIYSTNGTSFLNGNVDTTLHCVLYMGSDDVTASISDADLTWERTTDDSVSDAVWNAAHVGDGKYVNISMADLINRKAQFWITFNV